MGKKWHTIKQIIYLFGYVVERNAEGYLFLSKNEWSYSQMDSFNPEITRKIVVRPMDVPKGLFGVFSFTKKILMEIKTPAQERLPEIPKVQLLEHKEEKLPVRVPTNILVNHKMADEIKEKPIVWDPFRHAYIDLSNVFEPKELVEKLMMMNDADFLHCVQKLSPKQSGNALTDSDVWERLLRVSQKRIDLTKTEDSFACQLMRLNDSDFLERIRHLSTAELDLAASSDEIYHRVVQLSKRN